MLDSIGSLKLADLFGLCLVFVFEVGCNLHDEAIDFLNSRPSDTTAQHVTEVQKDVSERIPIR